MDKKPTQPCHEDGAQLAEQSGFGHSFRDSARDVWSNYANPTVNPISTMIQVENDSFMVSFRLQREDFTL